MKCFFIIFASVLSAAHSDISNDIVRYFKSNNVQKLRKLWEGHRKPIEQALASAMQETIGKEGLNVFTMKPTSFRLSDTYYLKHDPVEILLKDLDLVQLPNCWLPDAIFSLSSNVLKIETTLTKMIINAEYILIRNSSDLISDKSDQDPYKLSPFQFKQVQNTGQVSILVDGCLLSGYIIAKLKSGSIDLGHENFKLINCEYTVEIYNKDTGVPPVIVQYSDTKAANSLEIKHYLLRLLKDEFITKLQATVYSYINTSAIIGQNLPAYEEEQGDLFFMTSNNLTKRIRDQNNKILNMNGGAVNLPDYYTTWDTADKCPKKCNQDGVIRLSKMVLTGLGTAYYSNTGGPFKLDSAMIGEQIRFNTLQVRGEINSITPNKDPVEFSIEISDFAVNVEIDVQGGGISQPKIEVVGFRKIELAPDVNVTLADRTLLTGYLVDEVSKAIIQTITASRTSVSLNPQLAKNMNSPSKEKISDPETDDSSRALVEAALKGEVRVVPQEEADKKNNEVPKD